MLHDSLADFEGEIEPRVSRETLLEMLDNTKGVKIVIEGGAKRAHQRIEAAFAGVAKRRVANVVNQGEGFGEIDVEAEGFGYGASDLRNFEGVRQAIAKVIGVASRKDLSLGFEAAKSARMNDAI